MALFPANGKCPIKLASVEPSLVRPPGSGVLSPQERRPLSESSDSPVHVPVLDGVRGLAICLVLIVHFTPDYLMPNRPLEWLKKLCFTGWTGVDLFFVLSGFLITGILLKSRGRPNAARNFYARRALRILPLYLGSLICVFGVLPWFVTPGVDPRFDAMRSFQMWYWAHSANMVAFLHGFEAMNSATVFLSHFWSLAVEEHFYLVWPLLVWKISDRKLPYVAIGLIVSAFLLRVLEQFFAHPMTGTRVLVPERMDSLAIGGLVAILFARGASFRLKQVARVALPLCCAILGTDFLVEKGLWTSSPFVRTIGLDVIAIGCASLMILLLTNARRSIGNRLIDNPFLRCMGKYSYGMYVIHWILAPTLDRWFPESSLLAICGSAAIAAPICLVLKSGVTFAVCLLSWHLIEQPFLRQKRHFC
jgi:peptidoglycan/LPS O-acetylase OafA/YrhL